jgi:predicted signal transduction protein with EAL and GGDEF domain
VDLESNHVVGFESLARFAAPPARTPDLWFAEAGRVGLAEQLEARAIERALVGGQLGGSVYVAYNASASRATSIATEAGARSPQR